MFWVVKPGLTHAGGACQGVWWGRAPVWVPPLTAAALLHCSSNEVDDDDDNVVVVYGVCRYPVGTCR
jgi:hypothetical protein